MWLGRDLPPFEPDPFESMLIGAVERITEKEGEMELVQREVYIEC